MNADIEIINKKYEDLADIIEAIPKSAFTYDMDIKHLVEIYSRCENDKEALEFCLRRLRAGQKEPGFMSLPYPEKREFLSANVKKIMYAPVSKELNIEYLDDINSRNRKAEVRK